MKKTEVELAEGYTHQEAEQNVEAGVYPFFTSAGQRLIHCEPAEFFTACIAEEGKEPVAVIAMANRSGGLCSGFTAAEMREAAQQMLAMADWIEKNSGSA